MDLKAEAKPVQISKQSHLWMLLATLNFGLGSVFLWGLGGLLMFSGLICLLCGAVQHHEVKRARQD